MPAPRLPVTAVELARRQLNLTQEDLSRRASVSARVIGRVERGHTPMLDVAQKIAAALGRTVDDLFPAGRPRLASPVDVAPRR